MPRLISAEEFRQDIFDVFNLIFPMLDQGQKETRAAFAAVQIMEKYSSASHMAKLTGLKPDGWGRLSPARRATSPRKQRKSAAPRSGDSGVAAGTGKRRRART
jgi:hypothetical protein